ncbi:hypothetical protein ACJJTC_009351 [Scirpophaga incertulas]
MFHVCVLLILTSITAVFEVSCSRHCEKYYTLIEETNINGTTTLTPLQSDEELWSKIKELKIKEGFEDCILKIKCSEIEILGVLTNESLAGNDTGTNPKSDKIIILAKPFDIHNSSAAENHTENIDYAAVNTSTIASTIAVTETSVTKSDDSVTEILSISTTNTTKGSALTTSTNITENADDNLITNATTGTNAEITTYATTIKDTRVITTSDILEAINTTTTKPNKTENFDDKLSTDATGTSIIKTTTNAPTEAIKTSKGSNTTKNKTDSDTTSVDNTTRVTIPITNTKNASETDAEITNETHDLETIPSDNSSLTKDAEVISEVTSHTKESSKLEGARDESNGRYTATILITILVTAICTVFLMLFVKWVRNRIQSGSFKVPNES